MISLRRRSALLFAAGLGLMAAAVPGCAQMHKVQKQEPVVRAVGVYEWTGDMAKPAASRFIPVSIYINNTLQDAAVYLARPVPFTLQTGTIFDLDHAGIVKGTFELSFARHLEAVDTKGEATPYEDGWFGYGVYRPLRPPVVKAANPNARQSKSALAINGVNVDDDDSDKPVLIRRPGSSSTTDASTDADRPTMGRRDGGGSGSPAPADDPDRPKLSRKTDVGDTASNPAPADDPDRPKMSRKTDAGGDASSNPAPPDDSDRPTLRKRSSGAARDAQQDSGLGVASLNDDPSRPTMRRGKPVARMNEDDLPRLKGLPVGVHQMVAVSDAVDRPLHDFTRPWESMNEATVIRGKMREFARAKVMAYGGIAAPAPAAATGATPAARRRAAAKAKEDAAAWVLPLEDEEVKAYTLSYGGAATYVLTATATGAQDGAVRYVTVVAQADAMGELKVAMASVTDAMHLDRTPWMRLVDVVDVEASNRASLLVELRAQHSRQFALYRVIGAQSQQIFTTGSTQ